MANSTITGLPDLQASQNQKFIAINDSTRKIEGLAVNTLRAVVITSAPVSPSEGITYLCNGAVVGLSNTASGSFVRYTKPSNDPSTILTPQVYTGTSGMSLGGFVLVGSVWVPETDISAYGTDMSNWPNSFQLITTVVQSLTSSVALNVTFNGAGGQTLPLSLPIGAYTIAKNNTQVYIRSI